MLEVKNIMIENIEKVLERGEKLDLLGETRHPRQGSEYTVDLLPDTLSGQTGMLKGRTGTWVCAGTGAGVRQAFRCTVLGVLHRD